MLSKSFSLALCAVAVQTIVWADDSEQKLIIKGKTNRDDELILERPINLTEPDVAQAISTLPGANFNQNGMISVIPQYRGHIGFRTTTSIDGSPVVSAGPNLMDPPLSYANTNWISEIILYRGITPVSVATESIGSHVAANYTKPDFTSGDAVVTGHLHAGASSAASVSDTALTLAYADDTQRLQILASDQAGDDFETPIGTFNGTEFDKQAQQLDYGVLLGNHQFDVSFAKQDVDESGTPALPMDIIYFDGERTTAAYQYQGSAFNVSTKIFDMDVEHVMNNVALRTVPLNRQRETFAVTSGGGARIDVDWDIADWSMKAGVEQTDETHTVIIGNPNNSNFRVVNFNDAERDNFSSYIETTKTYSGGESLQFGVRHKSTDVNTGDVSHHMSMMNPNIAGLVNSFNSSDRSLSYSELDWMMSYTVPQTEQIEWYFGVGEKNRMPMYQELYLWLPMQATGGLADGNVYVGDVNLRPETALQFEVGLTFKNDVIRFTPQVYYHDLTDYIQGVVDNRPAVNMAATMMGQDRVLRFANVDGSIVGFDAELVWSIDDNWRLRSVMSMVRGERSDIDDPLYRIMPDNIQSQLTYTSESWQVSLELELYDDQSRVSEQLRELATAGYGLVNVFGDYQLSEDITLTFGINNLLDKTYFGHLVGVNRTANNIVLPGERVPGIGRDFYFSLDYRF
jgi:iron complex outermembrane receptor protein